MSQLEPKKELLTSPEVETASGSGENAASGGLTKAGVETLYKSRLDDLGRLRASLSLKLVHRIEEKLRREKEDLERLLNLADAKQDILSHYSFVLNPYYFEQKFFGEEE